MISREDANLRDQEQEGERHVEQKGHAVRREVSQQNSHDMPLGQDVNTYTIALGTIVPAFSTSSDMCATESCPSTTNMLDTLGRVVSEHVPESDCPWTTYLSD